MPSDGVFCYILKHLSDAERNNDKIYGVIRGVHVSAAGPGEGTPFEKQARKNLLSLTIFL
jgi:acyl transferase domain-containing protein